MGINRKKFSSPAIKGDISGVVIDCMSGFRAVHNALRGLRAGENIDAELAKLSRTIKRLDESFNELTDWTDDK